MFSTLSSPTVIAVKISIRPRCKNAKDVAPRSGMAATSLYFSKYLFLELKTLLGIGSIKDLQRPVSDIGGNNRIPRFSSFHIFI
jgi:hypothetical protein